ncbi:MAG: hypothetical protein AMXMBFR53_36730 [Gemmatimonadota bacterium]
MSAEPLKAEAMDDELATREVVPEVWRPSQSKERYSGGGLSLIQRTIVRHRLEEAAMAAELVARLVSDIPAVAGAENGVGSAARARLVDANTLAATLDEHRRDFVRPSGVDVKVVRGGEA